MVPVFSQDTPPAQAIEPPDYNRSDPIMATSIRKRPNTAAQALGRLGGRAGTDAQNRARALNAKFAGRPKRVCRYCAEPVIGGHQDRRLDDTCGAHGWRWKKRTDDPHPPVKPDPTLLRDALAYLEELPSPPARLIARVKRALRAAE